MHETDLQEMREAAYRDQNASVRDTMRRLAHERRERLAAYCHAAFGRAVRWAFAQRRDTAEGTTVLSQEAIALLHRTITTPYAELTAQERDRFQDEAGCLAACLHERLPSAEPYLSAPPLPPDVLRRIREVADEAHNHPEDCKLAPDIALTYADVKRLVAYFDCRTDPTPEPPPEVAALAEKLSASGERLGKLALKCLQDGVHPDSLTDADIDAALKQSVRSVAEAAHEESAFAAGIEEDLSAYAHEAWSRCMLHIFRCGEHRDDGAFVIPPANVSSWERKIATPYAKLPELDKVSRRLEARHLAQSLAKIAPSAPHPASPLMSLADFVAATEASLTPKERETLKARFPSLREKLAGLVGAGSDPVDPIDAVLRRWSQNECAWSEVQRVVEEVAVASAKNRDLQREALQHLDTLRRELEGMKRALNSLKSSQETLIERLRPRFVDDAFLESMTGGDPERRLIPIFKLTRGFTSVAYTELDIATTQKHFGLLDMTEEAYAEWCAGVLAEVKAERIRSVELMGYQVLPKKEDEPCPPSRPTD